jgi:transposase
MISNNIATRSEIAGAFKVPERSISRWLALFKEKGEDYFFSGTQV